MAINFRFGKAKKTAPAIGTPPATTMSDLTPITHATPLPPTVSRQAELLVAAADAQIYASRSPWVSAAGDYLDPLQLAAILKSSEQGVTLEFLELAEKLEEVDPHYRSVVGTRKMQTAAISLTVEAASDAAPDQKIAEHLRDMIADCVTPFVISDLMDGIFKGFAVAEIIWQAGKIWTPREIAWRDPRWFHVSVQDGRTLYLLDAAGWSPLLPGKFICHVPNTGKSGLPIRNGLARVAAFAVIGKIYDLRMWLAFAEAYGSPIRIGKFGPEATESDKAILRRAVTYIAGDAAAIIPNSMEIAFQSVGGNGTGGAGGGGQTYESLLKTLDSQLSKLVLGQTGTTDTGQHVGTADAHDRVRNDLETWDAAGLAATLTRDLAEPFVRLNFGAEALVPRIEMRREDALDRKLLVEITTTLADYQVPIPVQYVLDKLGIPDAHDGEALLVGAGSPSQGAAPGGMIGPSNSKIAPIGKINDKTPIAENNQSRQSDKNQAAMKEYTAQSLMIAPPIQLSPSSLPVITNDSDSQSALASPMNNPALAYNAALQNGINLAASDWVEASAPILNPLQAAVSQAKSYKEAAQLLNDLNPNTTALAHLLGDANFAAYLFGLINQYSYQPIPRPMPAPKATP
ncbi:MAG: DUF935 family protein [Candidatus Symbiobacter sp.]|nr:DUF935 family protein [Candidatus Symbiobacter sp.]